MAEDMPQDAIELRVDRIAQLFHSLDPYPFRERDLDKDAEDYVVAWARELDRSAPITIVVHVPESEAQSRARSSVLALWDCSSRLRFAPPTLTPSQLRYPRS